MTQVATTGVGPRLRLHESAVIEDRGGEVAVFVADTGSGSVLRGVPALMLSSLHARFGADAFTPDAAARDEAAGTADQWRSTLDRLAERDILVSATAARGSVTAPKLVRVLFHGNPEDAERLAALLSPLENVGVDVTRPGTGAETAQPGEVAVQLDHRLDVRANLAFAREQNTRGRPSVLARVYGRTVELGPWTVPRRTPCFECYWLRLQSGRQSTAPSCVLSLAAGEPGRAGRTLEARTALILLAGEIGKCADGAPPVTLGQVVRYELRTLELVKHKVMRVPSCATCAAARRDRS